MRTPYSFSILRYVHDPVTQEFINIGVAVYARESGFIRSQQQKPTPKRRATSVGRR